MHLLPDINKLIDAYDEPVLRGGRAFHVRFTLVYLQEAHASDEWPIGIMPADNPLNQHVTIEDRVKAACRFELDCAPHPKMRILLDTMENTFNSHYPSWPTRGWIINQGKIAMVTQPPDGPNEISSRDIKIDIISNWLKKYVDEYQDELLHVTSEVQ